MCIYNMCIHIHICLYLTYWVPGENGLSFILTAIDCLHLGGRPYDIHVGMSNGVISASLVQAATLLRCHGCGSLLCKRYRLTADILVLSCLQSFWNVLWVSCMGVRCRCITLQKCRYILMNLSLELILGFTLCCTVFCIWWYVMSCILTAVSRRSTILGVPYASLPIPLQASDNSSSFGDCF